MRLILAITLVYLYGCSTAKRVIVKDCHFLSRGFADCEHVSDVKP